MDSYEARLHKALVDQHRRWFDYESKGIKAEYAESIPCPVCGSTNLSIFMEKDFFKFNRCNECSMVFLNPRLNVRATYAFYNSEWTAIYNEAKFVSVSESTEIDNSINQRNIELIRAHADAPTGTPPKLLEIGFGSGYFLRAAEAAGFDVHGLDVDISNVERARLHFGERVQNCDLYDAGFPAGQFDVVYMRDVFEHVPNPGPMLKEINRISGDGALLYIEVPNIQGLIYSAVGARHVCVFGFAHLNYWSPDTLRRILDQAGYNVAEMAHESLDCTATEIVRYYRSPSFTAVYPEHVGKTLRFLLTVIYGFLRLPPIAFLDRAIFPRLANWLQRGSVLKAVAKKRGGHSQPTGHNR